MVLAMGLPMPIWVGVESNRNNLQAGFEFKRFLIFNILGCFQSLLDNLSFGIV